MASTQTWSEYNGAGLTETTGRSECNWKNIDDSTTAYTDATNGVISAPASGTNYSYWKLQALKFAGTWGSISALKYFAYTGGSAGTLNLGTGLTLNADVPTSSTGMQPAKTQGPSSTCPNAYASGLAANLVTSSTPWGTGTSSSTASGTMYAQPFRTQLAVGSTAGPGDITNAVTLCAQWTES